MQLRSRVMHARPIYIIVTLIDHPKFKYLDLWRVCNDSRWGRGRGIACAIRARAELPCMQCLRKYIHHQRCVCSRSPFLVAVQLNHCTSVTGASVAVALDVAASAVHVCAAAVAAVRGLLAECDHFVGRRQRQRWRNFCPRYAEQ